MTPLSVVTDSATSFPSYGCPVVYAAVISSIRSRGRSGNASCIVWPTTLRPPIERRKQGTDRFDAVLRAAGHADEGGRLNDRVPKLSLVER